MSFHVPSLSIELPAGSEIFGQFLSRQARTNHLNRDSVFLQHGIMATPGPDGSFAIPPAANTAIPTGNYRVLVGPILTAAAGWASPPASIPTQLMSIAAVPPTLETAYVKSIRMGDLDVLNDGLRLASQPSEPLVILIGTNPGSLEGRVFDSQPHPVAGSTVVLIPENGLQFRTNHKFTSTDASGKFQITKVPPGDYSVYAWDEVELGACSAITRGLLLLFFTFVETNTA